MRYPASLAVLALTLALAPAAGAQASSSPRLGLEVTGGLAIPLGDAADTFDSGTHFGGNVLLRVIPAVAVYGGYSTMDMASPAAELDLTLKGFEAGVRLSPGLALGPVSPTVTVGATFFTPEGYGAQGSDIEGEREVGYRAGLGLEIPLGELLTASVGGSLVSHPFGDFPMCPPSRPNCLPENSVLISAGLRVNPPLFGGR